MRAPANHRPPEGPGSLRRLILLVGGAVACLALLAGQGVCLAQGDDAAEEVAKIKSAFLLNFARFTTWPEEAFADEQSPLVIAVVGRPRLLPYLAAIVRGETVNDRRIEVRVFTWPEVDPADPDAEERMAAFFAALGRSHMVFLPSAAAAHTGEVLARLRGAAVLTVSDAAGFVDNGGMLQLRELQGRVVFDANADAIAASGVEVSSKVLRLARYVKQEERR